MIGAPLLISGAVVFVIFGLVAFGRAGAAGRKIDHSFIDYVWMIGLAAVVFALFYGSLNEGWFA